MVAARSKSALPINLKDSKLLSKAQRQGFMPRLTSSCDFGEGWVSSVEIDLFGLSDATRLGVKRALVAVKARPDEKIIVDGHINYAPSKYINCQALINADEIMPIVSAASIYAKVKRDKFMTDIADTYINYGFETHMGYGTKRHKLAIEAYGIIDNFHRLSFVPLKKLTASTI